MGKKDRHSHLAKGLGRKTLRMGNRTLKRGDFEPSVRYVNGLTIYFKDKDTVVAMDDKSTIICERWFDRALGSYAQRWKPFCEVLKTRNYLSTTRDVWNIAFKYEIGAMVSRTRPTIPDKIKVRVAHFKAQRRKK